MVLLSFVQTGKAVDDASFINTWDHLTGVRFGQEEFHWPSRLVINNVSIARWDSPKGRLVANLDQPNSGQPCCARGISCASP